MIPLLHLLLVCHSFLCTAADQSRLLQVQIIIRHADLAPMYEFTSPETAKLFPRGLGEVTNEGLLRAAQQGALFKNRYKELGLLSEQPNDSEIYVRSSPIKRTLMSAAAFSASFIGVRVPRIHTTENLEDEKVLIVHHSIEHRCEVLARYNISGRPACRMTPLIEEFIKDYPECAMFDYAKIEAALAEVENSRVHLDGALEKCARGDARKIQYRSLSIRPGVGAEFDKDRARASIGHLMAIVSKNVDDAARSDLIDGVEQGAAVRIYYTHDHVILGAAQALGILDEYEGRSPGFSSAIAIETWSSNNGFDIKILLKDGLNNPFKNVAKYRFLEFKKQISPFTVVDSSTVQWDKNASKVYFLKPYKESGPELSAHVQKTSRNMQMDIPMMQNNDLPVSSHQILQTDSVENNQSMWTTALQIFLVAIAMLIIAYLYARQTKKNQYARMEGNIAAMEEGVQF